MPGDVKGQMTMLSTREDRTLYFDFLPLRSDAIKGFVSRFQLYTVPGQPVYDQTRRIALTGTDGLVFVADSQWQEMENNVDSFENLVTNLEVHRRSVDDIPYVLQFNKRDVPDIAPVHYLDFVLNQRETRVEFFESVAVRGDGVQHTLNTICKMVMAQFVKENNMELAALTDGADVAVKTEKDE